MQTIAGLMANSSPLRTRPLKAPTFGELRVASATIKMADAGYDDWAQNRVSDTLDGLTSQIQEQTGQHSVFQEAPYDLYAVARLHHKLSPEPLLGIGLRFTRPVMLSPSKERTARRSAPPLPVNLHFRFEHLFDSHLMDEYTSKPAHKNPFNPAHWDQTLKEWVEQSKELVEALRTEPGMIDALRPHLKAASPVKSGAEEAVTAELRYQDTTIFRSNKKPKHLTTMAMETDED